MDSGAGGSGSVRRWRESAPVSPTPSPPPPPSMPGAPASLSVQAADGQSAEPQVKPATRPAVIVRGASGRAVPNVALTYSVDSGGGSLSFPTTAADATFSGACANGSIEETRWSYPSGPVAGGIQQKRIRRVFSAARIQ